MAAQQRKVAKPGDVVRVKVLEVEPKRRRISFTMRLDQALGARPSHTTRRNPPNGIGETFPIRRDARRPKQSRACQRRRDGRGISASGVGWENPKTAIGQRALGPESSGRGDNDSRRCDSRIRMLILRRDADLEIRTK